ncbi:MAG: DNA methyltransferase [Methylocystis sp.]|uniref:DNA methyltransferase n=1 Tax=Methylocystis sp. TaxID=1911079 RepID=UPI003D0A8076
MSPNIEDDRVEKTKHPCQFQVALVERLALSLTNSGDSVCDMGVGSSAIAALKHGRKGFGCNVVEDDLSIAWDRIFHLRAGVVTTQ